MTQPSFYSDRTGGPRPRDIEMVTESAWRGLVALIDQRSTAHWLAQEFPDQCPDGNGVAGTDHLNLGDTVAALIPDLAWPPKRDVPPATETALDLIEFVAQRVAKPQHAVWHSYYRHYEMSFDVAEGRDEFRRDVNLLLARSGIAFELGPDLLVVRLGPPEARQVLADLRPDTGDAVLDRLVTDARLRYLSRHPADERLGLEKLWDAFERLKTIEPGKDKKSQVTALLDRVATGGMRKVLEEEALQLTNIGNTMQIRHFETGHPSVADDDVDYLFTRMAAFVLHVLRATGRLSV